MDGLIMDARTYDVHVVPDSVKRLAQLLEGVNAGDMLSGLRKRDLKGTNISYTLQIEPKWTNPAEYDALFDRLADPVDTHAITLPYGQTTLTFDAMVQTVEDGLIGEALGVNRWHGLSVKFIPIFPQKAVSG